MEEYIRINKALSDAGACSRREADRLIEEGEVTVNGRPAVMGMKVLPSDDIRIRGTAVKKEDQKVVLLLNKPRGIVCTTQQRETHNVIRYLNYPLRVYPVGRLDKDSEGLLLLTNRGELVNRIMKGSNYHEKEYVVTVNKELTADFLRQMRNGVPILDTMTRPCRVYREGPCTFRIILTQGLNRQIRRMCEYLGYEVVRLKRIRIMNLTLEGLAKGAYREITPEELKVLEGMLKGNTPEEGKGQV